MEPEGETGSPDGSEVADGEVADVERLSRAIEELADAARRDDGNMQELAERLARVWGMVAELDPELARRLAGYDG